MTKDVIGYIIERLQRRRAKGLETYNKTLDALDLDFDWVEESLEELFDLVAYFEAQRLRTRHLQDRVKELEKEVERLRGEIKNREPAPDFHIDLGGES